MHFELNKLKKSDGKSFVKHINNPKVARYMRDIASPYEEKNAEQYLSYLATVDENEEFVRGIFIDGKAVGAVALTRCGNVSRHVSELGYWLGESYWGMGVMTEAVKLMCEFAFRNLGVSRIESEIVFENFASRKVLEKCGFLLEGVHRRRIYKEGAYYDTCTYAKVK